MTWAPRCGMFTTSMSLLWHECTGSEGPRADYIAELRSVTGHIKEYMCRILLGGGGGGLQTICNGALYLLLRKGKNDIRVAVYDGI